MSWGSVELMVHRLLAASHPEPIDRADVVRRLALPVKAVEYALAAGVRMGVLRRVRPMRSSRGYAYTVEVA